MKPNDLSPREAQAQLDAVEIALALLNQAGAALEVIAGETKGAEGVETAHHLATMARKTVEDGLGDLFERQLALRDRIRAAKEGRA
ncbi:hypothetical protein [uncultured Aquimonas sp.]|uniref:hypothetical protein n=1 Tax=uncultured Aquimonas sp. TaxID=385483 RepID=UPI00086A1A59|nr:hypothetical protein [uncultured Aquimonas sp.]ODU41231.1 MAG: hypothetical protein ABS96_32400 [Xanthomonadaceae bacterium SCN 69-123]